MTSNALIFALEGLIGSGSQAGFFSRSTAVDALPRQQAQTWLECMKIVLRSKGYRDRTDWEIGTAASVVDATSVIDASGGLVIGVFLDSIGTGANLTCVLITDTTGQTWTAESTDLGGADVGDGTEAILIKDLPAAASATAPSYSMQIYPNGVLFSANLEIMADDDEGTTTAANELRAWVVYSQSLYRETA